MIKCNTFFSSCRLHKVFPWSIFCQIAHSVAWRAEKKSKKLKPSELKQYYLKQIQTVKAVSIMSAFFPQQDLITTCVIFQWVPTCSWRWGSPPRLAQIPLPHLVLRCLGSGLVASGRTRGLFAMSQHHSSLCPCGEHRALKHNTVTMLFFAQS